MTIGGACIQSSGSKNSAANALSFISFTCTILQSWGVMMGFILVGSITITGLQKSANIISFSLIGKYVQ